MKKGIYITVPKTAQTSLMKLFKEEYPSRILTIDSLRQLNRGPTFDFSKSTTQLLKENISQEVWANALKFCFIRNPWDRYVSNWRWLTRKDASGRGWNHRGFKSVEGEVSFKDFVLEINRAYNIKGQHYQHDRWHIWNQIDHIVDPNGKIMVDHVLKFESLHEGLRFILDKLNLPFNLPPHLNYAGFYEHQPKAINPHYSTYYTDDLIEIVRKRCEPDITAFNYSFEKK
jgi:hypothetical protein